MLGVLEREMGLAIRAIPLMLAGVGVLGCSREQSPPSPIATATAASLGNGDSQAAVPELEKPDAKLGALAWETKVYDQPSDRGTLVGYLRAGALVGASSDGSAGPGCKGKWHLVAPRGYVCVETGNATLDPEHGLIRALTRRPDTSQGLPYMYGIVRKPGPLYTRLPTRAEAEAAEPNLGARMLEWVNLEGDSGARFRPDYWMRWKGRPATPALELWQSQKTEDVPPYLAGQKFPPANFASLPKGTLIAANTSKHNGFAIIDTAVADGRRYAITSDLNVYPVDRLRPIEGSAYRGYQIPKDIDFPFALVRREGAALYSVSKGKLTKVKDVPRREALKLTGKVRFFDGRMHFQTIDGLYISDQFASRIEPLKRPPKWAKEGERWMDVSIGRQSLVAYEGERAVFATLVSTGEAGLDDPEKSRSTKRGIFRVHTKHVTTTMSSELVGEEFELRDIPYVQYFEGGYALHAAYWHDDFGKPRSHGCINLSPEDARWLFFWTEPSVPSEWHGVRKALTGSVVFVHP